MRSPLTWQRIQFYFLAYPLWLANVVVCAVALLEFRSAVNMVWLMTGRNLAALGVAGDHRRAHRRAHRRRIFSFDEATDHFFARVRRHDVDLQWAIRDCARLCDVFVLRLECGGLCHR